MSNKALILFAHGSRDPQWRAPMEAVAQRAAALDPKLTVRCAYLELMEPDLPHCVAELVQNGANDIAILPMFLGVGRHAREDLPVLISDLRAQYPALQLTLRPAIGEDPHIVDMLARFALQKPA